METEQGKALILMYHRVDRAIRDRWGLCVSPENFNAHLRHITQSFEPVRLPELVGLLRNREVPHRAVAVTFDDGYRDNLTVALPLLKEWRVPATFFISGEGAAVGETFWWEIFDSSLELMDLDEGATQGLFGRLMSADPDERRQILKELPLCDGPFPSRLSIADLSMLTMEPLAEIGAHGWSHRALASMSVAEQRRDITDNMGMLAEVTGNQIRSFAYPFGGPFTAETVHILRKAGIEAACTVVEKAVTADADPLMLPRVGVENWSGEEFAVKLEAFLGG